MPSDFLFYYWLSYIFFVFSLAAGFQYGLSRSALSWFFASFFSAVTFVMAVVANSHLPLKEYPLFSLSPGLFFIRLPLVSFVALIFLFIAALRSRR